MRLLPLALAALLLAGCAGLPAKPVQDPLFGLCPQGEQGPGGQTGGLLLTTSGAAQTRELGPAQATWHNRTLDLYRIRMDTVNTTGPVEMRAYAANDHQLGLRDSRIGTVEDSAKARIGGELRQYREPLLYRLRRDGDELVYAPNLRRRLWNPGARVSWGTADSRSSLTIATGGTFNRVEGLPIVFGPLFDWKLERNFRLRVDALGVLRSAGDLSDKRSDLGYMFRSELRAGDVRPVGIAVRAFDVVSPVEDWGLHSAEVGWSTFVFGRDYRGYYLNKGR